MSERIVRHPKYGRGVVKASRFGGHVLEVEFQDKRTRRVYLEDVEEVNETATISRPVPPAPTPQHINTYRRMIEAFRLGIVPHDCVEKFTFGRQGEIQQLVEWLASSEEGVLLLVGEYGTGKTHLLDYIYWYALHHDFAVAKVEMDPNEAPFYKPKRVYSHLIQTFRYPPIKYGKPRGFRDFIRNAFIAGALKDHEYFRHLIGKTSDETLWDWIEAREAIPQPRSSFNTRGRTVSPLPGLYDSSTAANLYCYLLSGLGWAAKEVFNLKGLLLVFDEAETVEMSYAYRQMEKSHNFLKALVLTAQNDKALLGNPYNAYQMKELDYSLQGIGRTIPFLYRQPSNLKLLFAFTPTKWLMDSERWEAKLNLVERGMESLRALGLSEDRAILAKLNLVIKEKAAADWYSELRQAPRIYLEPLAERTLQEVFSHIYQLYRNAYAFSPKDLTRDRIFQAIKTRAGHTRTFVKGSVEALDLIRLNPGKPLNELFQ